MLARIHSFAVFGIEAWPLDVEVDVSPGMNRILLTGLPQAGVRESRERIESAIRNSGYRVPRGRVLVHLAPADLRKESSALDLPIALGMLAASDQLREGRVPRFAVAGELALDGSLRPVGGALAMALAARDTGLEGVLIPPENAEEAGVVDGIAVIPVHNLDEAASFLSEHIDVEPHRTEIDPLFQAAIALRQDFSDVKGQAHVKRALTVAAAGAHNVLMSGPPGTGKTMLASRLPGILPDMTFDESLETTRIYSVAPSFERTGSLVTTRPFRSPHHTSTTVSISGGGAGPSANPGEVSLAHNGVLFLDELPEFNRAALEVLRQPLEDGMVHIRRANYAVTFPSRFMLVVAMNPCPCGYLGDPRRECRCSQGDIQRYRARLSGPLIDRIDIHVDVPPLPFEALSDTRPSGPDTGAIRAQVQAARDRQAHRYKNDPRANAYLDSKAIRTHCRMAESAVTLLGTATDRLGLSPRAYDKVLRVARTLADLDGVDILGDAHIAEAVQYRPVETHPALG